MDKNTEKTGYLNQDFKIFNLNDKKDIEFNYHHHDFYKIIIFISGDVTYYIEGIQYDLKPSDILFIGNNMIHKPVISPDENYKRIAIWINPKFIDKYSELNNNLKNCFLLANKNKFYSVNVNLEKTETILEFIEKINTIMKYSDFGNNILKNCTFLELMVYLNKCMINNKMPSDILDNKTCDNTIEEILQYIEDNLCNDLSIDNLSKKFFISKYYLMRKFKSQTDTSIHNYIVQKRLLLAKKLIKDGFLMNEVCSKCGFNDYSNFVRAFKKIYGFSPKNYKQESEFIFGLNKDE